MPTLFSAVYNTNTAVFKKMLRGLAFTVRGIGCSKTNHFPIILLMVRLLVILVMICFMAKTGLAQSSLADSIITPLKLKNIVYQLADDSLKGRYWNSKESITSASIIAGKMKNLGLKKLDGINGYYQDVYHFDETILKNVIGILPGKSKKDELVIFSAHYDHIGTCYLAEVLDPNYKDREKTNDTIYNGANDNASGVAAMLAIAGYYLKKGPQERSIVFIAFSGEEIGMYGSGSLTNLIARKNVVAQFNLEMLGRRNTEGENPFITGDSLSDLRILMNNCLEATNGLKDYFLKDFSGAENLFYRSDNIEMAKEGVPAHTIMLTSTSDPYYHSPKDEPSTLDYKLMATIVKNIAIATECFVNGTVTPRRIKSDLSKH